MRRFHRNTAAALGATVLMLGAAACGGGDNPKSDNSASPTVSTSPSSTSPSPTSDAWKKKYSAKQLKAYQAALARWNEYEQRSEPIWARGKATQAAANLFKDYFPSPFWQGQYKTLASYEQSGVKVEGTPGIYWSRAKFISKNSGSVEINQCVDYTKVTVTQHGKDPGGDVPWLKTPQLRTISMEKPKGYDWLVYRLIDETNTKKSRPCER